VTGPDDDAQWRRPGEGTPSLQRPQHQAEPGPAAYTGPPTAPPPPSGWHPPVVMQFPPPRSLPPQDLARLDETEQQARTISYGVAMVTGAIMILLVLVLCGRALF
jgi:hypothetical protein